MPLNASNASNSKLAYSLYTQNFTLGTDENLQSAGAIKEGVEVAFSIYDNVSVKKIRFGDLFEQIIKGKEKAIEPIEVDLLRELFLNGQGISDQNYDVANKLVELGESTKLKWESKFSANNVTTIGQGYFSALVISVFIGSSVYWKNYFFQNNQNISDLPAWIVADGFGALGGALGSAWGDYASGNNTNWVNLGGQAVIWGATASGVGPTLKWLKWL